MTYFLTSSKPIENLLRAIQKQSLDDLFCSIPLKSRIKGELKLPQPLSELELKRNLSCFSEMPKTTNFIGAGATEHFVPEWVSQQLLRAEWYTAYTPYQPEASQGTLQAIFEFQSMVCSLLGMEVANGSMYDGATALVEALLMSVRVKRKKTVLLTETIHPEYRQTVKTYLQPANINVLEVTFDKTGTCNLKETQRLMNEYGNDIAAIAIQSPNFFGQLESVRELGEIAHANNALCIGLTTECVSLGLIKSFGQNGADIAVGEALGLLGGLNFGGPGLGLFACQKNLVRQMPGRIVGQTVDKNKQRAFTLTLSTREQHIRRERATSNICTNHNLMALAFCMTLSAYGKTGFINLSKSNLQKTIYFRNLCLKNGLKIEFDGPHFNETVINLGSKNALNDKLNIARQQGILAGLDIGKYYKQLDGRILVNCSELHEDEKIRQLADILGGKNDNNK